MELFFALCKRKAHWKWFGTICDIVLCNVMNAGSWVYLLNLKLKETSNLEKRCVGVWFLDDYYQCKSTSCYCLERGKLDKKICKCFCIQESLVVLKRGQNMRRDIVSVWESVLPVFNLTCGMRYLFSISCWCLPVLDSVFRFLMRLAMNPGALMDHFLLKLLRQQEISKFMWIQLECFMGITLI